MHRGCIAASFCPINGQHTIIIMRLISARQDKVLHCCCITALVSIRRGLIGGDHAAHATILWKKGRKASGTTSDIN